MIFEATNASGIYIIYCLINGKYYIGSSKHIKRRFGQHIGILKRNRHPSRYLQYAWNKHGEGNFICDILEYCPKNVLMEREQWYLDQFKPHIYGYNHLEKAGSSLGRKYAPEIREKMKKVLQESNGIEFEIVDPEGNIHKSKCISKFAQEHGISKYMIYDLLYHGNKISVGGWHLPSYISPEPYKFLDSFGNLHVIPKKKLAEFSRKNNIHCVGMHKVWGRAIESYKGWCRFDREDLYVSFINDEGKEIKVCNAYPHDFVREYNLSHQMVRKVINRDAAYHKNWKLKDVLYAVAN